MPIPANRVKDLCFVHIHTNAAGASDPGYPKTVFQTMFKQPVPPGVKVLCTRGAPQNQQFFGASIKKGSEERQLNFLDKALYSIHLEEFTDGQGGRGQVCAVLAKLVPGPQAVKCACGRMVNPGPKARCPYCGRSVVATAMAKAPAAGGGDGDLELLGDTEATVAAVPGLDATTPAPQLGGDDLAARMASRARGAARKEGSWLQDNLKLVAGVGAIVVVGLAWVLFFRGKAINAEWKAWFEDCKWDLCIPSLEKQVASGAAADRAEMALRLAQAKAERAAQAVTTPGNSGPDFVVKQSQWLTSSNTLFMIVEIQNTTISDVDLEPKDFYVVYHPAAEAWQAGLAEAIEEAPFAKTTLPPKMKMRFSLYVPMSGKSINYMFLVFCNGTHYRRSPIAQNFPQVSSKSFIDGQWKATSPEAAGGAIAQTPGGTPTPTPPPVNPDTPVGPPQPPQTSMSIVAGNAIDIHGWHIEVSGCMQTPMLYGSVSGGLTKNFTVVTFKLYPQSDEAAGWPLASNDFKLWGSAGELVPSVGASVNLFPMPTGTRPAFAEWFQVKVGEPGFTSGPILDGGQGLFTDRIVETVANGKEALMEVVFSLDSTLDYRPFRAYAAFGSKPAEPPSAAPGSYIGGHWTNISPGCRPDAISLGNGQSFVTKFATEDWLVKVVEPLPMELYPERKTTGDRGMVVRVRLEVTPWLFRASKAAAPPLDTSRFGLRSPKGEEWKPMGWVVESNSGEVLVDKVTIVGSDTEGEARIDASGGEATLRIGQGGVGSLYVILEGFKDEGGLEEYMLIHGLKTQE